MHHNLNHISPIYQGLLLRNRAFASYKKDELEKIYLDLANSNISIESPLFDPMSGYGGGMIYFGKKGYSTINSELNPPAYYWQLLINPNNTSTILEAIDILLQDKYHLPKFKESFSLIDDFFTENALKHIDNLHYFISKTNLDQSLSIALLLPFISRFANYSRSSTNITHFKKGGLCLYSDWEKDFYDYLIFLKDRLYKDYKEYKSTNHKNILSDIMELDTEQRFQCFITSPPYPNYRDYSKLFIMENFILDRFTGNKYNFEKMIGSNHVCGKKYGQITTESALRFLDEFRTKSLHLKIKSQRDIETYYYPYFAQYFYNIEKAYQKLNEIITPNGIGYIVVNDNIARDIIVPVGITISEIFQRMHYKTEFIDIKQVSHYGNIVKGAKRLNSRHTRYILKVCKQ